MNNEAKMWLHYSRENLEFAQGKWEDVKTLNDTFRKWLSDTKPVCKPLH